MTGNIMHTISLIFEDHSKYEEIERLFAALSTREPRAKVCAEAWGPLTWKAPSGCLKHGTFKSPGGVCEVLWCTWEGRGRWTLACSAACRCGTHLSKIV